MRFAQSVNRLRVASVTGVDVELRIAGLGGRTYAFVVDLHIRVLAAIAWFFASMWLLFRGFDVTQTPPGFWFAVVAPSAGIYFLYHPILEVVTGTTPGKRTAGLRIVTRDGQAPGIGPLAIRNVLRLLDSVLFYAVGMVSVLVTRQAVRIGDIAAGTILVYAGENTADTEFKDLGDEAVARVGLERLELSRDLLRRWNELKPDARRDLARRLLRDDSGGSELELRSRLEELAR